MELKRQGMAINEQLNAKEEKFAKNNKHMLASMIKQYGEDKGTRVFYATVREKVKKLHEDAMIKDVPTSQEERDDTSGTTTGVPVMGRTTDPRKYQSAAELRAWEQRNRSNQRKWDAEDRAKDAQTLTQTSQRPQRPQPLPQPVAKPNSNPGPKNDIDRMTGRGLY
jgi:hypothetical protein